jgi:hypothetical protein
MASVHVRISLQSPRDLESLGKWLRFNDELHGMVTFPDGKPQEGRMGLDATAINAVVANALALGSLLVSIAAWRQTRPRPPSVNVVHNEIHVRIEGADPKE